MATETVPPNSGRLEDFDTTMKEVSARKTWLIKQIQEVNLTPKIDVEQFKRP